MNKNGFCYNYRLNRFLSQAGLGSRRKVESEFILAGRVSVNGHVNRVLHTRITPRDKLCVDGKQIRLPQSFRYYVLHKPKGYVVSSVPQKTQKTIYELLPANLHSLKYAGRLDKESRGLVVLSDDGVFIQFLSHARFQTPKRYRVALDRIPENLEDLTELPCKQGIRYEDSLLRAEQVRILSSKARGKLKEKWIEIVLLEGSKRHIRRMMEALGLQVLDLYRYAIGNVDLDRMALPEKKYRSIKPRCFFPQGVYPLPLWKEKGH